MNFDLRTCDTAYYFVLEFMNMTPDEYLTELVIECENDFEKFWKRNIGRITEVNIEDLLNCFRKPRNWKATGEINQKVIKWISG